MLALLLCLFTAGPEPAPDIKAIATGPWRHAPLNGARALAIRKGTDLAALPPYNGLNALPRAVAEMATSHLAADLKVKTIDWDRQMVLLVLAGRKGSGGYRVEVTGLKVAKGTLTVSWKLHAPRGAATDAITYPNLAVLVPRYAGKVVFSPPLGK